MKKNVKDTKREWELGFIIEAEVPIISFTANKARLIHYQSFQQLSQLILKLTDSLPNKRISVQDLERYFALPLPLAKGIFCNLIDEGYLIALNASENETTTKEAKINREKVNDLETIPSEEIIRPIRYNFSVFPRYYIPNYLLIEKNVSSKLKTQVLPQSLSFSPENIEMIRDEIDLPEEFVNLEPDSENKSFLNEAQATLSIIPMKNKEEPNILIKRSSIEPRRIVINKNHPDYEQIRKISEKLEVKSQILESIQKISKTIESCIEFDAFHKNWNIRINKIDIKDLRNLIDSLETYIPQLFSGNRIKRFVKEIPNLHSKLGKTRLICQISLDFHKDLLPIVFYEYLNRNFKRFQGDLDFLEPFLLKCRNSFLKYYNLSDDFPALDKIQLLEYYWNSKQFQFAYCLMALEDF
jgi:hypothetical protein